MRADAEDNRRALLEAAREVFVEEGTSVALDRIAKRAGVGIGTLYRRFPDRDALLRGVLVDLFGGMATAARDAEAGAGAGAGTTNGAGAGAGTTNGAGAGAGARNGTGVGARAGAGAGARTGAGAARAGAARAAGTAVAVGAAGTPGTAGAAEIPGAAGSAAPAWESLVRAVVALGVGPTLPVIFRERLDLMDDPVVAAAMREAVAEVEGVYRRAQEAGQLRADVSFLEIQLLAGMLSTSSSGRPPRADPQILNDRLVGVLLDGLRAGSGNRPLPGEPVMFSPLDPEDRAEVERLIAEQGQRRGLRG